MMARSCQVGVLDTGFLSLPRPRDLEVTSVDCARRVDEHGTMMASIIAAGFGKGAGVDGAARRVRIHTCAPASSKDADPLRRRRMTFDNLIAGLAKLLDRDVRVVNASLGYNWPIGIRPDDETSSVALAARAIVEAQGEAVRRSMAMHPTAVLVTSAGNDRGASAVWASPFNWAALGPRTAKSNPSPNVIVVEAVDANGGLLPISNRGGMIRAVGTGVPAITGRRNGQPLYRTCPAGTSCAAPQVAAAVALMLAANPALDSTSIKRNLGIVPNQPPPLLDLTAAGAAVRVHAAGDTTRIPSRRRPDARRPTPRRPAPA